MKCLTLSSVSFLFMNWFRSFWTHANVSWIRFLRKPRVTRVSHLCKAGLLCFTVVSALLAEEARSASCCSVTSAVSFVLTGNTGSVAQQNDDRLCFPCDGPSVRPEWHHAAFLMRAELQDAVALRVSGSFPLTVYWIIQHGSLTESCCWLHHTFVCLTQISLLFSVDWGFKG